MRGSHRIVFSNIEFPMLSGSILDTLSQLVFWMLAATNGHAKNFSIYHRRRGGFGLTPLYDVLSTWPVVGKRADQLDIHELKLAMPLRTKKAHYKIVEIQPRHFQTLADQYPDAPQSPPRRDLPIQSSPAKPENLSPEMESYIKSKVSGGFYGNATEVIRDAIRRMQADEERRAAFRAAVAAGDAELERGEGIAYGKKVLEDITREAIQDMKSGKPIDPNVCP